MIGCYKVSIPMTVLGGLQFMGRLVHEAEAEGFNTDDGIRWAAIVRVIKN